MRKISLKNWLVWVLAIILVVGMGYWRWQNPRVSKDVYKIEPEETVDLDIDTPYEIDMTDPILVAGRYLGAYVSKDWELAKALSGKDFDEKIADSYGFVAYEITASRPDEDQQYYHVYVKFFDEFGNSYSVAAHDKIPLEVMMFRDNKGNWKAMTWYFYE